MAIDQDGQLWAWGSNLQHRAGFPQEISDGVYQPTLVPFLKDANLKALKVSAGQDHALLLAQNSKGVKKFYSIGKEESNFKHLGISAKNQDNEVYREIPVFTDFEIQDFSASAKYSLVIIKGEEKPEVGLYEHELADGSKAKGILHFYKKEGKWHYVSQEDYEAKKDSLPDLCLAIKCPITDLEQKDFPDLEKLSKEVFAAADAKIDAVKSSVTEQEIKGARYYTLVKINGDDIELNLSEEDLK